MVDEWGVTEILAKDNAQYREWHNKAIEAFREGIALMSGEEWETKSTWKFESENSENGDKVYSKENEGKGRAFAVIAKLPVPVEALFTEMNQNVAATPEWDSSIREYRILFPLGDQSDVVYSVTADALGGLVSSRDILSVRLWRKVGESWLASGQSITWDGMPPQKGKVRAHGHPGLLRITPIEGEPESCLMELLMNTDLKGYLPMRIIYRFMNTLMLQYVDCLRKHVVVATLKN